MGRANSAGSFAGRHATGSALNSSGVGRVNTAGFRGANASNVNNFNRFSYAGSANRFGYGGYRGYGGLGYGGLGYGGLGYGGLGYGGLGYGGLGYGGLGYGGLGFGGLGYGLGYGGFGYGLGGLGYGLGGLGGYGGYGGYGGGYGGYGGYGGGYGGYGGGGFSSYGGSSYGAANGPAVASTAPAAVPQSANIDFAARGDQDFNNGQYDDAIHDWQHALVDDPTNGGLVMLLAQAYFAKGHYDEAAGAVQHGMQMLPQDKWGLVVEHYRELYRSNQTYTDQLRALEAARTKDASPGIHFLLGYHYAYLGHPQQAVRELDKTLKLHSQDQLASQLRDMMRAKLSPGSNLAPAEPST
jgi:tetratricopeptide (TPR) repeat protein